MPVEKTRKLGTPKGEGAEVYVWCAGARRRVTDATLLYLIAAFEDLRYHAENGIDHLGGPGGGYCPVIGPLRELSEYQGRVKGAVSGCLDDLRHRLNAIADDCREDDERRRELYGTGIGVVAPHLADMPKSA